MKRASDEAEDLREKFNIGLYQAVDKFCIGKARKQRFINCLIVILTATAITIARGLGWI